MNPYPMKVSAQPAERENFLIYILPQTAETVTVLFRQLGHVTFFTQKKLPNFGRPYLLNA